MKLSFLQIEMAADAAPLTAAAEPIAAEKTLTIIDLMFSGGIGGQLIMGTMLMLSVLAVYLFVNRLSAIRRADALYALEDHAADWGVAALAGIDGRLHVAAGDEVLDVAHELGVELVGTADRREAVDKEVDREDREHEHGAHDELPADSA